MVSYKKHCPDFRTLVIQNEKLQIIWNLQMVPEELQYGQYIIMKFSLFDLNFSTEKAQKKEVSHKLSNSQSYKTLQKKVLKQHD